MQRRLAALLSRLPMASLLRGISLATVAHDLFVSLFRSNFVFCVGDPGDPSAPFKGIIASLLSALSLSQSTPLSSFSSGTTGKASVVSRPNVHISQICLSTTITKIKKRRGGGGEIQTVQQNKYNRALHHTIATGMWSQDGTILHITLTWQKWAASCRYGYGRVTARFCLRKAKGTSQ